jgi:hypothetical protein
MSGGVVGGLSSVAMGGDFWQGFTQGAASAGLSFAANEIAGEVSEGSGSNTAGAEANGSGTPVNPVSELPDASTLPKNQRTAYLLQGADAGDELGIKAQTEQAAADLKAKGYHVVRYRESGVAKPIPTEDKLKVFLADKDLQGQTVVVSMHHWLRVAGTESGSFDIHPGDPRVPDSHMIADLAGARRVIFLGCHTDMVARAYVAANTGSVAWGASGTIKPSYHYKDWTQGSNHWRTYTNEMTAYDGPVSWYH